MTNNGINDPKCVTFETSKIQLSDINEIINIAKICFPDPWSYELFLSEVTSRDSVCIKINKGIKIIAFIMARFFVEELHIMYIAVLPEYRKKGIAGYLVNYLLDNYKSEQCLLEVSAANTAAINLYQKAGFVILGRRKAYYSNGDDAVVMSKGKNNAG